MNSFLKMGKYKTECNKVTQIYINGLLWLRLSYAFKNLEVVKFEGRDIAWKFSHLSILGAL